MIRTRSTATAIPQRLRRWTHELSFCRRLRGIAPALALGVFLALPVAAQNVESVAEEGVSVPDWLMDLEIKSSSFRLIQDIQARQEFQLSGAGLAVAVIDSGVNAGSPALRGVVLEGRNFTRVGTPVDTDDNLGSGSHRAGVIAAQAGHQLPEGVAPGVKIIPVKVLDRNGATTRENLVAALRWVAEARPEYRMRHNVTLSAVYLGMGVGGNFTTVDAVSDEFGAVRAAIKHLTEMDVVVCAPSGNEFRGQEGMSFPAICPETISVGTVNDANIAAEHGQVLIKYAGDIEVYGTRRDQIAAFSQRLCADPDDATRRHGTDVFAPGVSILSVGHSRDQRPLIQSGTAVSAAFATGAVVLLQERCRVLTQRVSPSEPDWLPDVALIRRCLHQGAVTIVDDRESNETLDNAGHTGHAYRRLDVLGAVRVLNETYQSDVIRLRQRLLQNAKQSGDLNGVGPPEAEATDSKILGKQLTRPRTRPQ